MVSLRPIETMQLGDRAYEAIREAIITAELLPGSPIKDRELAEALQLSRTPVRDALRRLEATGLVEMQGRRGWFVGSLGERDVRELFQLRRLLEPAGLDELAARPDPAAIATIAGFFNGYAHPLRQRQFAAYFARDHAFHTFIVACSQNLRLQGFYDVIAHHIVRGRHYLSYGALERVDETLDEHEGIARAVEGGDFGLARSLLLQHLSTGEERMLEQLRRKAGGEI